MQRCLASLHIAASERVAVALLQIDSVRPRNRIPIVRWAIDMQPYKRARVQPVRRRWIRGLVADAVQSRLKSTDVVVIERASRIVSCSVEGEPRLIRVARQ